MNRIYPFRGKNNDGDFNWLENIQVSYSSKLENRVKSPDSTLFSQNTLKNMQNGFSHSIPISLSNIKLLKFINITPGVSYSGVMYTKYIQKSTWADTSIYRNTFKIDTIQKLTYAHSFGASIGISASPKIYGMFVSTRPNSFIAAVRHVITPSASFSYSPNMAGVVPNYYRKVATPGSATRQVQNSEYSVYEGQIYGTPSASGQSGSLSLGLTNNLEAKLRTKSDTTGEGKKVVILDFLNLNTRYNPFAPTFQWSTVNMSGATTIFNKKMNLQFGSTFDLYALDSAGNTRINKFLINETGKLLRATSMYFSIGYSIQSAAGNKKKGSSDMANKESNLDTENPTLDMLGESSGTIANDYVDFDIPWTININYYWSYSKPGSTASYNHTFRFTGNISITPKWKIGGNTGYDFIAREFTTTNLSIYRDLHCWEMRFGIVPFGNYKSYSFTISAKSTLLHDLKWDKRKSLAG